MHATCPHCRTPVELVGTSEITEHFGLTPNMIQHAIATKRFPEPWLRFNNRSVWLRDDINEYKQGKMIEKTENAKRILLEALSTLEGPQRKKIIDDITSMDAFAPKEKGKKQNAA